MRVRHFGDFFGDHQIGIFAGDADSLAALLIDGRDDLFVDLARQNHFDDFDGRLVGDAQAVHEIGGDLEFLQHAGDLRPATVDHDRVDARLFEIHNVLGEGGRESFVAHGVAAEFHDHGLFVVADQMGYGFSQYPRVLMRRKGRCFSGRSVLGAQVFRCFHGVPQERAE